MYKEKIKFNKVDNFLILYAHSVKFHCPVTYVAIVYALNIFTFSNHTFPFYSSRCMLHIAKTYVTSSVHKLYCCTEKQLILILINMYSFISDYN